MSEPTRPIRPELLAAKIEKIENFELPRLLEEFGSEPHLVRALWFLQWVSQPVNYPGGLSKFAEDLIQANVQQLGMPHMLKLGTREKYRARDAALVLRELPESIRENLLGVNARLFEEAYVHSGKRDWASNFDEVLVKDVTPATVRQALVDHAGDNLGTYFKELCELPRVGFRPCDQDGEEGAPWYFAAVADAVLAFMDVRGKELRSRIAETEITREIRRWIAKSRSMRRPVMFIGNTRFGKTETIRLEAAADPGNCRLVDTPASNAIGDLLREVAKSLGIEVGSQSLGPAFQSRIDHVLRFSRLQLIFDESQFLIPASYSRNTSPKRLNWVRRSIIDQGTPAIFVCTPQSYLPAKQKFVKATGFAMQQFDERILKTVQLPEELSESDALAVARIHFAGLPDEYLGYVVDKVLATERNFVSDIEKIATLAKDNAREHSRNRPALADIEAAISDVLPTVLETDAAPTSTRKMPPKPVIHRPCKVAADALPMPRRGLETLNRDRFPRPAEVPA